MTGSNATSAAATTKQGTMVCIASYEKGQAFLREAARHCHVHLLTTHKLRHAAWPFDSLAEVHTVPNNPTPAQVLQRVRYIARHTRIDRIVPLDEFDLEAAALVREDMRLPGMGESATRLFRDKLAMRVAARDAGLRVPGFTAVHHYATAQRFLEAVPGPWLLKPRTSASAIGIRKISKPEDLWSNLDQLGDEQANFLLEAFLPGTVFHVDSVTWQGRVLSQSAHQYGSTPMSLMHGGGVFTTRTLDRQSTLAQKLRAFDAELIQALGMRNGVTHTEFIQADADGELYFLETAARVGGAFIAELMEHSAGFNPWTEWARIEVAQMHNTGYTLRRHLGNPGNSDSESNFIENIAANEDQGIYAGSIICLARQEHPDLSAYNDPEIVLRMPKNHHAGLIVASPDSQRIQTLTETYRTRFAQDFAATLPPPDKPTS